MEKVNRNKTIRIGAAIISTTLIASMSGCSNKEKDFTNQQKQLIASDTAKMTNLNNMFNLSTKINTYFRENNLSGKLKEKSGIKYIDYPSTNTNTKDLDITEIEEDLNELSNIPTTKKIEDMTYINTSINTCDLLPAYEHLYRIILTNATGEDYNNNSKFYILEGEKILKENEEFFNGDYTKIIMSYYNIDQYNAELLANLIENKQELRTLYEAMERDPNFGPEDYIIDSEKNYKKIINTYYDVLYNLKEANKNHEVLKIKTLNK